MDNHIKELKDLYLKYVELHAEYDRIEQEAKKLESERLEVKRILDETRERETSLINKLEEEIGEPLTADDLLEMIRNHEN